MGLVASDFAGSHILVTGGLGFIGSNLVRRLAQIPRTHITVVDSLHTEHGGNLFNVAGLEKRVQVHVLDLNNSEALLPLLKRQDFIFNLAGQVSHIDSMEDPITDTACNYLAHLSLLEGLRKIKSHARVVYTSTRQVYGRPQFLPVDESHGLHPIDVNGVNKLAAEKLHLLYYQIHGLRCSVLRLTNTYGPRQLIRHNRQGFISWFIHQAIEGSEIQVFGDGTQLRELNYVDDVVKALMIAATCEQTLGGVYNLGAGRTFRLIDVAETVVRHSGRGNYRLVPFPADRAAIDIGSFLCDYGQFHSLTGWNAETSLDDGMRATIDFFDAHRDRYC